MITFNASGGFGTAGKQYVARILGRDAKFTFRREFIGKKSGKRGDFTSADVDDPGLYEIRDVHDRRGVSDKYRLLVQSGDDLVLYRLDKEEAMKVARILDEGVRAAELPSRLVLPEDREGGALGFLSTKQAEKHATAATVDAALAICAEALAGLSPKNRKAVLAQLRKDATEPAAAAAPENEAP